MVLKVGNKWIVLLLMVIQVMKGTTQETSELYNDYQYEDPEFEDDAIDPTNQLELQPRRYFAPSFPRAGVIPFRPALLVAPTESTTECGFSFAAKVPETEDKSANATATEKTTGDNISSKPAESEPRNPTAAPATTPATATLTTTTTTPAPPPAATSAPGGTGGGTSMGGDEPSNKPTAEEQSKSKELQNLVQHLYIAQARVQLEATEIKKAQAVANAAQEQLEEAANHVRAVSAALQSAQQAVATAAIRAQTAQLQLAAHDQLLFAARQDVDALSSQMVGLQAAEGVTPPRISFDVSNLLQKLKQPLSEDQKPTPVPRIVPMPTFAQSGKDNRAQSERLEDHYYE